MLSPTPTRATRALRVTGLRGVVSGAVCAVGAMTAHAAAGGEVTTPAAAGVLLASVLLAPRVLGAVVDPARTLSLSLVVQVVWHVVLTLGGGSMPAHHGAALMAGNHLLAALLAAGVAVHAERSLVQALEWLVGVALPRLVAAVQPPSAPRRDPGFARARRLGPEPLFDDAHPLRAPPALSPLG